MVEQTPVCIKQPVCSPEIEARLEGDRQLVESVTGLIKKGVSSVYWSLTRRLPDTSTSVESEHQVTIRPQKEDKDIGEGPNPDWLKVPVLVEVFTFGRDRQVLEKQALLIDFARQEEAQKTKTPFVRSVNDEEETDLTAPHQKRVALASQLLQSGVPVSDILGSGAEKLGLTAIRDLFSMPEKHSIEGNLYEQQVGMSIEEVVEEKLPLAIETLEKTVELRERPVLANLAAEKILSSLKKRIVEENAGIDEILTLPEARVLADPRVWGIKKIDIAGRFTDLLVGELRASGLEGEALRTSDVMKFLMERWGDDYVRHLSSDLLIKLQGEEIQCRNQEFARLVKATAEMVMRKSWVEISEAYKRGEKPQSILYSQDNEGQETLAAIRTKSGGMVNVDVACYERGTKKPEKVYHFTIDNTQEEPRASSYSSYTGDNKQKEPYSEARYKEHLDRAFYAVEHGIPYDSILNVSVGHPDVRKYGIHRLLGLIYEPIIPPYEQRFYNQIESVQIGAIQQQHRADELGKRARRLESAIVDRPILGEYAVRYLLNEVAQSDTTTANNVLKHHILEVLTDERVLKHKEIASIVDGWLAGLLAKTSLEGDDLLNHEITNYLKEHLGDLGCYTLFADKRVDIFRKLPSSEIGRVLAEVEKGEKVTARHMAVKRELLKGGKRALKAEVIGLIACDLDWLINSIILGRESLFSHHATFPILMTFLTTLLPTMVADIRDWGNLQGKLDQAQQTATTLKDAASLESVIPVDGSEVAAK